MTPKELITFFETSTDFQRVDTTTFVPMRKVEKIGYYNKTRRELYFIKTGRGFDPLLLTFPYNEKTKDIGDPISYEKLSLLEIFEGRLAIRSLRFFS
jgi:hypothetical protein